MKTRIKNLLSVWTLLGLLSAQAQQTPTFTYQGRLDGTNGPVTGSVNLTFRLYDVSSGGAQLWQESTNGVAVANGLFALELGTATPLTGAILDGNDRWLEIMVNGVTLANRQKITHGPYAIQSRESATANVAVTATTVANGGVSTASLQDHAVTSAKITDGSITSADVNAASFSNTFWKVDGNAGTTPGTHFLGTTDNQALELRANNFRALRIEPKSISPNLIGGYSGNSVATGIAAAVIGGGGLTNAENRAGAELTFIGGGSGNTNSGSGAFLGGGSLNVIELAALESVLGGGSQNRISSNAVRATISGGLLNVISNDSLFATISGGGENVASGVSASLGGGYHNQALANDTAVGGGYLNIAAGPGSTVSGGRMNSASGDGATVAGGVSNSVVGAWSTVAGGRDNAVLTNADYSAIGGGNQNTTEGPYAAVPGGFKNLAGPYSFAAGSQAQAIHRGSFVWADSQGTEFGTTSFDQFLIRAAGGVGINTEDPHSALHVNGTVTANSFAGNGANLTNVNAANLTGLGSAGLWTTNGNAGANPTNGAFLGTSDNLPLEVKVNGQRALRIEPAGFASSFPNWLGGYSENTASTGVIGGFIGGGGYFDASNRLGGDFCSVVGGVGNTASGDYSTAMGFHTTASGRFATAMGGSTRASGDYSTAIGVTTTASGAASTALGIDTMALGSSSIAMGYGVIASKDYAIAMGHGAQASGQDSIAAGFSVTASGGFSLAMGANALAAHFGSLVLADASGGSFSSGANNEFAVRAAGGVRLATPYLLINGGGNEQAYMGGDGVGGDVEIGSRNASVMNAGFWNSAAGSHMNLYALTFNPTSDRNLKQNFKPVDPEAILNKVVALPLTEWAYKADQQTRHLGPVAQDFRAAFNLGSDDKSIATVDADGVVLAAIQGLNQKVEAGMQKAESRAQQLEEELHRRDTQITQLKLELEKLNQVVDNLINANH